MVTQCCLNILLFQKTTSSNINSKHVFSVNHHLKLLSDHTKNYSNRFKHCNTVPLFLFLRLDTSYYKSILQFKNNFKRLKKFNRHDQQYKSSTKLFKDN